jgi:hypothetical protein
MKNHFQVLGIIFIIAFSATLFSCKTPEGVSPLSRKQEDFDKFYDRFHKDMSFQMSRIKFPLEGEYTDGDKTTKWSRSNWIPMKEKIYDIDRSTYKVSYKRTEDSFSQKVWLENAGFSAEYRFQLTGRKWHLVYAMDSNL